MTNEEMFQDYLIDKVIENPDIQLSDLIKDKKADDEWMEEQIKQAKLENTQNLSEKQPKNKISEVENIPDNEDFEEVFNDKIEG